MVSNINSNRTYASGIVSRALDIADIANTDFLSYNEKTKYLNDTWKNVYQKIIDSNIDLMTVTAVLFGSGGRYRLPFDFYQMRSVKNPVTGRLIPRAADSESLFGGYYQLKDDYLILGNTVGPVTVEYWRKPFWLSFPQEPFQTDFTDNDRVIDSNVNSVLYYNDDQYLVVSNVREGSILETAVPYITDNEYYLGYDCIVRLDDGTLTALSFSNEELYQVAVNSSSIRIVRSDDGQIYYIVSRKVYDLSGYEVGEVTTDDDTVVGIDSQFYTVPTGAFPIGVFDDRPAFVHNKSLFLINNDGTLIEEPLNVPSVGRMIPLKCGFLLSSGKVFSNIPDTFLNFPNNLYYDVISYDLAARFLAKQNADSSGVDNLNRNAWSQLLAGIDAAADYKRVKLVRR